MKQFLTHLFALTALVALTLTATAQGKGGGVMFFQPLPMKEDAAATNQFDLHITNWTGQTFVFLERPKPLQKYGYSALRLAKRRSFQSATNEWETDLGELKYEKFVGKRFKVVAVEYFRPTYILTFEAESSGQTIYADAYHEFVDGIAPAQDLERAKERWLGKTIWSKVKSISSWNADRDEYGEVTVRIGEPMKIVDVRWGTDSVKPIWLVVETERKERGFVALAFSWTNICRDWWKKSRPWEDIIFESDPKQLGWSDEVWTKIRNGEVAVGMTKDQVLLVRKPPDSITEKPLESGSRELWTYGDQSLYFEGDVLRSIRTER